VGGGGKLLTRLETRKLHAVITENVTESHRKSEGASIGLLQNAK